jgi:thioesterase domain-containing protein
VLNPSNIEAVFPLSAAQKAYLFEHLVRTSQDSGFVQVEITGGGCVTMDELKRAWRSVVKSQPVLRSSIHWKGMKQPQLVVLRQIDWEDKVYENERNQSVSEESIGVDASEALLKLDETPTWSWEFTRLGDREFKVVWSCHHALLDGWSGLVIVHQWFLRLNQLSAGKENELPDYRDAFRKAIQWRKGRDIVLLGDYWRERLEGIDEFPGVELLPTHFNSPLRRELRREILTAEESSQIRRSLRDYRVSGNVLTVAAWGVVLGRAFDRSTVFTGTVISGRGLPISGFNELGGLFSGLAPVVVSLGGEISIPDWLSGIKDQLIAGQERAPGTVAELEEWTGYPSLSTKLSMLILYQDDSSELGKNVEGRIRLEKVSSRPTGRLPLLLAVVPGDQWEIVCEFDPNVLSASDVDELLTLFLVVLRRLGEQEYSQLERLTGSLCDLSAPELAVANRFSARQVRVDGAGEILNSVQWRVLKVFRLVFRNEHVAVGDDFFELGGNSMLAGSLFQQVEKEFNVTLPLSTIIEYPSAERLATYLTDGGTGDWKSLVPLRSDGFSPPLFCLHAGGLEVLMYRPLAQALKTARPVFGVQPPGLRDGSQPESLDSLARSYVSEIRAVQSTGPYFLLVYCFSVRVVIPMIRQLAEELDERVSLVVIDTGPPVRAMTVAEKLTTRLARTILGIVGSVIKGKFGLLPGRLRRASELWRDTGNRFWLNLFGSKTARQREKVRDTVLGLSGEGLRRSLEADCLLVRSSETAARSEKDFHLEWERYTSSFETLTLESEHRTLLEPGVVESLAESVEKFLLKQERKL